jgi:hypothetical protein
MTFPEFSDNEKEAVEALLGGDFETDLRPIFEELLATAPVEAAKRIKFAAETFLQAAADDDDLLAVVSVLDILRAGELLSETSKIRFADAAHADQALRVSTIDRYSALAADAGVDEAAVELVTNKIKRLVLTQLLSELDDGTPADVFVLSDDDAAEFAELTAGIDFDDEDDDA